MIPPRTLNGENFGNGISNRVSACRKRLRFSRTVHRANHNSETRGQAGEIESRATLDENRRMVFATSGAEEEAEST
jgi:hypothetical protein